MADFTPGKIIILNGTSSAGKSTIAKELQNTLAGYYLHTGIDHFIPRMPPSFFLMSNDDTHPQPFDGFLWVLQDEGKRVKEIVPGPYVLQMRECLYLMAKTFANKGFGVIIDDVIFGSGALQRLVNVLAEAPAWFVGVQCPKEEAIRREEERGDRTLGLVEAHYDLVHAHGQYDLEVNTATQTTEECAEAIKQMLINQPMPEALSLLRNTFQ